MKRVLAVVLVVGLIVPTTAAAHFTVMKPGSRFWVLSSRPPKGSEVGNKFNPYVLCRHGISGNPATDPVYTTPGGFPLRLTGVDPERPTPSIDRDYLFSFGHDRWSTRLRIIHAPHQPPVWEIRAVNPNRSRKALFFWRCRHPGEGARI
jgi:hypothetical protein